MSTSAFELRVGGRVWLDGQGWEAAELGGTTVRLVAEGRVRTVSVASLAPACAENPDDELGVPTDQMWAPGPGGRGRSAETT